jgi:RNA polymerase sigma factor (TIGR02999 family)
MEEEPGEITKLLHRWRNGSVDAENELFRIVMPRLRGLAHYLMKGQREGLSLQPEELVNEVYCELVAAKDRDWRNRRHFIAFAGRAMRHDLLDYFKKRRRRPVLPLEKMVQALALPDAKIDFAIEVDRLLKELATVNPDWCEIVELKFFLGLTDEEAADAMGLTPRTFQRKWHESRKWMFERLK